MTTDQDSLAGRLEDGSAIIAPESWTRRIELDRVFPSPAPLEVDVGCGKGRFLITRATRNPDVNYLGIDRMLRRLRKADRKVRAAALTNVRLLRIEASYALRFLLPPRSVTACYISFPDPWPKRRHSRRRLFNREFLDTLASVLQEGGRVYIATDHAPYFAAITGLFGADARFQRIPPLKPTENERTEFERVFLGIRTRIRRCAFALHPVH
jgi:tRNA (guanine-N7-)-methyltransferase